MGNFHNKAKRNHQRGSALLIVFVFAAVLAVTLFTEMPVVIFEAQRVKEQLLIDRGNEYSQAVKLYVRKTGQYPANIEALENTNRVRFLRKKFKDPFTDKADWRLLHAGPNGMLIDSKLKVAQTVTGVGNSALGTFNNGQNGGQNSGQNQNSPFGQSSTFGTTNPGNSGFNSGSTNGFSGGFNGGNSNGFGANPIVPAGQVPLNVSRSNGADNPMFQGGIAPNADGIDPTKLPSQQGQPMPPGGNFNQQQVVNPDGTISSVPRPQRSQFPNGTNGSAIGAIDSTQGSGAQAYGAYGAYQNPTVMPGQGDPNNPNAAVSGLFANPNPPTPQNNGFNNGGGQNSTFGNNSFGSSSASQGFGSSNASGNSFGSAGNPARGAGPNNGFGSASGNSFGSAQGGSFGSSSANSNSTFGSPSSSSGSTFGALQNGGLAGVASKAERHSIKTVNDQHDYSLWEFYYDPSKDPARNGAGMLSQAGGGGMNQQTNPGNSPIGQQNGQVNQSGGFGNQSSPFGNQSGTSGNSGFGSSGGGFGSTGNSQTQGLQNSNGFGSQPNFNPQQQGPQQPPQQQPPPQ